MKQFEKISGFVKKALFSSKKKMAAVFIVLVAMLVLGGSFFLNKPKTLTYQTATAIKGTLITSVSGSGTITAGTGVDITTSSGGVVDKVFVKQGDAVTVGQKIAELSLDPISSQKQIQAWASYLSAKAGADSANAKLNSLQSAEFKANQKFLTDAVARGLTTNDPTYIQQDADWKQAEADYKNQQTVIAQAHANLSSSYLSYQQTSPSILAPASGFIGSLTISPSSVIVASSDTSQKLGSISLSESSVQASINLSEIDVVKVKPSQKVTLTLDALPDKTFTGKVLSINTDGSVSSGVTTYPATISFDSTVSTIYPNMAVSAKIITDIRSGALLIPSTAIIQSNGQSSVRLMKGKDVAIIPVEVGASNDSQTEMISGLSEGDVIVTSVSSGTTQSGTSGATTSPFGGLGGNRGFGVTTQGGARAR